MCNPALAVLAVTVVTTAYQYNQAEENEDQQTLNLKQAAGEEQSASQLQANQQSAVHAEELTQRAAAQREEEARINTAAGEAGLGGNSVARQQGLSEFTGAQDAATIQANARAEGRQNTENSRGIASRLQGALNSTNRPSAVQAGLTIAGAGVSSYAGYRDRANAREANDVRRTDRPGV